MQPPESSIMEVSEAGVMIGAVSLDDSPVSWPCLLARPDGFLIFGFRRLAWGAAGVREYRTPSGSISR
jgi:hypothetical protein